VAVSGGLMVGVAGAAVWSNPSWPATALSVIGWQGTEESMNFFGRIREFLLEVQTEMRRTAFPTRSETLGATFVVVVFVIVLSVFLALTDTALSRVVAKIIGG
jgi:preprotein translocase SecE subunit